MEMFKLFDNTILDRENFENLNLQESIATYIFSIVWTKPEKCSLYFLSGRVKNGTWHNIISHPITENDGEISVKIGNIKIGTEIELGFGVRALTAIPKVAALLTNQSSGQIIKISPASDAFKENLEILEIWNNNVNITLL